MSQEICTSLALRKWCVHFGVLALLVFIAVTATAGCEEDAASKMNFHVKSDASDDATDRLKVHSESLKGMNIEKVRELVDAGANVNAKNKYNATPLYMASALGQTKIVKILLVAKADANATPVERLTPLLVAAGNGHKEIVRLLLDANAIVSTPKRSSERKPNHSRPHPPGIELRPNELSSSIFIIEMDALWLASARGYSDVVELLLKAGADVNVANGNGMTALYVAADNGHTKVVELLVTNGADVNDAKNVMKYTPLHVALSRGTLMHGEVGTILLTAKVDANAATPDGATPLMFASKNGHCEVAKILLESNANPNGATIQGATPLLYAASNRRTDIAELLLGAGADANATHKSGATALHAASRTGNAKLAKLLLDVKADTDPVTKETLSSPLYVASEQGHADVVELLLKAGANVNSTTSMGGREWTPLDIAKATGKSAVVELFKNHRANQ